MKTTHSQLESACREPSEKSVTDAVGDQDESTMTFSQRRNPRILISKNLARTLAKLGVQDEAGAMGRAVSAIASSAIASGHGYVPHLADVVSVQVATAHRLDEIVIAQLHLLEVLSNIESSLEFRDVIKPLKLALASARKESHD